MLHRVCVLPCLCSTSTLFQGVYVPPRLYSKVSMFHLVFIPRCLCSTSSLRARSQAHGLDNPFVLIRRTTHLPPFPVPPPHPPSPAASIPRPASSPSLNSLLLAQKDRIFVIVYKPVPGRYTMLIFRKYIGAETSHHIILNSTKDVNPCERRMLSG